MTTRQAPKWFEHQLADLGGRNPFGYPRVRVVWAPDRRFESGVMQGRYMYPDSTNPSKSLQCWMLETWMPPDLFREGWNEAILGEFPHKGMYGLVCPIAEFYQDGRVAVFELTEATLDSIKKKYMADQEWAKLSAEDRFQIEEDNMAEELALREEKASKQADDVFDHVVAHEHEINQEITRVWSMPEHLATQVKGNKLPLESNK
ncbi:hypothetical protein [Geitlerinema calcuttense]|uniref:Uncharacterized protein n=1 Tax=Geitlerinema calcuttense NRMC-F 0142 TaxID=2922238 RepID=A0ABT7LWG2_9CYAN|nr:hypothetical protein [Geitlerinema calcuttense]MDL5055892.1 hypothetical protein [Geitlerinema calcuttense NRMC-F 0142]